MKIKLTNKYIQLGLTIFITAIALMGVYFLFFRLDSIRSSIQAINKIMMPIYFGFIFAYLMTPLLNSYEKKIFYPFFGKIKFLNNIKNKNKKVRGISILFTLLTVLLLIYLFFASLIPQVYSSIQSIINNYNNYTENLVLWAQGVLEKNPNLNTIISQVLFNYSSEADDYLNDAVLPVIKQFLLPNINDILLNLSSSIMKVFKILYNFLIGIIISLYVLTGKEKFISGSTKIVYALFETKTANSFIESIRFIHKTFIGFLSGKILDSAIIGIICYICALFMKLPYPVLIGVIVGVTNIIPFFGPFFGAIPSAIIILMVNPSKVLPFIILIIILQQIDGNLIGPMILSESTGLTSFWIIFAITLFGGLFGVLGMVIGVPITAVIFTGLNKLTDGRLLKKNLSTEITNYYNISGIDEDGNSIPYIEPPKSKEKKNLPKPITYLINKIKSRKKLK